MASVWLKPAKDRGFSPAGEPDYLLHFVMNFLLRATPSAGPRPVAAKPPDARDKVPPPRPPPPARPPPMPQFVPPASVDQIPPPMTLPIAPPLIPLPQRFQPCR